MIARALGVADIVTFVGAVPYHRIAEAYVGTGVVVNPRLRPTAYDHALIVGMASGVPVITTDIGDQAFVAEAGREAIVVPAGDVGALARAITTALTDRTAARLIGEAGRARVESAFTMEQTVTAYSHLLHSLIAGSAGKGTAL